MACVSGHALRLPLPTTTRHGSLRFGLRATLASFSLFTRSSCVSSFARASRNFCIVRSNRAFAFSSFMYFASLSASGVTVGLLPAISLSDDSTHDVSSLMLYQKLTVHGYARRVIAMRSFATPRVGCNSKAMVRSLSKKRDRYARQRLQKLRQVVPVLPAEVLDHCNLRRLSFAIRRCGGPCQLTLDSAYADPVDIDASFAASLPSLLCSPSPDRLGR
jgi:hypothetical protein